MGTEYYQTRCTQCNKILGQHWFYETYSMFSSVRDDSGSWGTSISQIDDICPFCNGKLIVESIEENQYNVDPNITDKEIKLFQSKNREKMIEQGRFCSNCKRVEFFDLQERSLQPSLREYKNRKYCHVCIVEEFKKDNPNPSNDEKKYELNSDSLSWDLKKVLVACKKCGKKRWLNVENQWKKMCITCYRSEKRE